MGRGLVLVMVQEGVEGATQECIRTKCGGEAGTVISRALELLLHSISDLHVRPIRPSPPLILMQ